MLILGDIAANIEGINNYFIIYLTIIYNNLNKEDWAFYIIIRNKISNLANYLPIK